MWRRWRFIMRVRYNYPDLPDCTLVIRSGESVNRFDFYRRRAGVQSQYPSGGEYDYAADYAGV